jgi:hypothetical protein
VVAPNGNESQEKPPDPSKNIFEGQVIRKSGDRGFVACDETFNAYGKDVYMWKSYFYLCELGDWVKFQIHVSEKGLPQICWLESVSPGVPPPQTGMKRPADEGWGGPAKRPMGGQPWEMQTGPQLW